MKFYHQLFLCVKDYKIKLYVEEKDCFYIFPGTGFYIEVR